MSAARRSRSFTPTAVAAIPSRIAATRGAGRVLPSGRSLVLGAAFVAAGLGLYAAARGTSMFAVETIEIRAGSPRVAQEVRVALADLRGRSLLAVGGYDVERRLAAVPDVQSIRLDRAFPHTLVVVVKREHPVAVLRQGAAAWLVSARGRVLRPVEVGTELRLPRVWVGMDASIRLGSTVGTAEGAEAVAGLAPLAGTGFGARVLFVRVREDELTFVLRSGIELRLGDRSDLRLKLAIARRILRLVGADVSPGAYVDVSVPERPVVAPNPQVEG